MFLPELRRPGPWRPRLKSHQPLEIGAIKLPEPISRNPEENVNVPPITSSVGKQKQEKKAT